MIDIIGLVHQKTGLDTKVIKSIIDLVNEGNTIPFIARYRKEMTEGATDTQLRDFEDVYNYQKSLAERKEDIIRLLKEKGVRTEDLDKAVRDADTLARLEDIYRPFKDKKNTRATKAIAKGLEPLATMLRNADLSKEQFETKAEGFIKDGDTPETSVLDREEAIQGAMDIVAERVSDDASLRDYIKHKEETKAILTVKTTKTFDPKGTYANYEKYSKTIEQTPSYAYLALARAEKEKQMSLNMSFDEKRVETWSESHFIPKEANTSKSYLRLAITDGLKRLVYPSIEREIRTSKKEDSDRQAIIVFGNNTQDLLLGSPLRGKVVMGFDPAFRTGCKIAIVDATGKFLHNDVIYPTQPQEDVVGATKKLLDMIAKYHVDIISIGNGTASRESEVFVAKVIKDNKLSTKYLITNEAGASVYSASKLANDEYPTLDVTVRGAISIAHRVQDPLSALVKIDPKSIGVGQYQHDVDQKLLGEMLDKKVQDTVNRVGVDVNTASPALLQYIAGLSKTMADNLIVYRDENGAFTKRSEIKKVKGIGPKAYEQAIGFLRIPWAKEPLDSTGIHPETYDVVYDLLEKERNTKPKALKLPFIVPGYDPAEDEFRLQTSRLADQYEIGEETLKDIIRELANPGLDPRNELDEQAFRSDVLSIDQLQIGMKMPGVVRNITDFGCFVDIGLKNDGLVHKSQMADYYVTDPFAVVKVGEQVTVRVVGVDLERGRVSLSMKKEADA